jgi:sugar phosphate isomerase/epimerase
VSSSLNEEKIKIAMLGAYFNPVHSNEEVVSKGIENFKSNLRIAKLLGNPYVGSETGSFNDSPWIYVPKNRTEEGYQATKKVFKELAEYAEEVRSDITIEPAWGHVIYSYQLLERLVKELNSKRVHVTIDLFNLLSETNFDDRNEIFLGALKTFGEEVKIIHIKDGAIVDGKLVQEAPGNGGFDYPFMVKTAMEYCPNATLVFEGVKEKDIHSSLDLLQKLL